MRKLIIMQGIPGSGKSFLANSVKRECEPREISIVSADQYFYSNGSYKFDFSRLDEVHNKCIRKFICNLESGRPLIIVDNTNTTQSEIIPYISVGKAYEYEVQHVHVLASIEEAFKRQSHNVPADKHEAAAHRLARLRVEQENLWIPFYWGKVNYLESSETDKFRKICFNC